MPSLPALFATESNWFAPRRSSPCRLVDMKHTVASDTRSLDCNSISSEGTYDSVRHSRAAVTCDITRNDRQ